MPVNNACDLCDKRPVSRAQPAPRNSALRNRVRRRRRRHHRGRTCARTIGPVPISGATCTELMLPCIHARHYARHARPICIGGEGRGAGRFRSMPLNSILSDHREYIRSLGGEESLRWTGWRLRVFIYACLRARVRDDTNGNLFSVPLSVQIWDTATTTRVSEIISREYVIFLSLLLVPLYRNEIN